MTTVKTRISGATTINGRITQLGTAYRSIITPTPLKKGCDLSSDSGVASSEIWRPGGEEVTLAVRTIWPTYRRMRIDIDSGGRHDVANIECFATGLYFSKTKVAPREVGDCIPNRCAGMFIGLHLGA